MLASMMPDAKLALLTSDDRERWAEYHNAYRRGCIAAVHHFIEAVGELAFTETWVLDAIWHARRVALYSSSQDERRRACDFLEDVGRSLGRLGSGRAPALQTVDSIDAAVEEYRRIYVALKECWLDLRRYREDHERTAIVEELEGVLSADDDIELVADFVLDDRKPRTIALEMASKVTGSSMRAIKYRLRSKARKRAAKGRLK
jgi:hypothetical protein